MDGLSKPLYLLIEIRIYVFLITNLGQLMGTIIDKMLDLHDLEKTKHECEAHVSMVGMINHKYLMLKSLDHT